MIFDLVVTSELNKIILTSSTWSDCQRLNKKLCSFSEIVRLLMSMQVDRINQRRIFWSGKYVNPNSKEYKTLEGESNYAVSVNEKLNVTVFTFTNNANLRFSFAKNFQGLIMNNLYCVFLHYFYSFVIPTISSVMHYNLF